jgi:diguanylate cyclase (GGDEF)-like protein
MRPLEDRLKRFTIWVALPTVLVYLTICALVLLTLHLMTGEINRIDGDRGRNAVNAALGSFAHQLGEQALDEATWTEAYLNTYVDFNPAWLDSAWGTTARNDTHYDTAIVTDAKGEIVFGESTRGPLTGAISAQYSGTDEMMRQLGEAVGRLGDDSVISTFAQQGAGVSALAAAVIHGSSGQLTVPAAERRILWLGKAVDAEMLSDVAHRFQVPVPSLSSERPAEPGVETLPLTDARNAAIGDLVWRPLRPGDVAFAHTASVASLALLIIGVLTFIVLIAFRRSVEGRAEAEERDWIGARYDASTGLLNRFGLEENLGRLVPRRKADVPAAVAYIEFEGLKDIAGSYGQETAEALLDKLADLIDTGTEGKAQLARLGPDEFAICRVGDDAGPIVRGVARKVLDIVSEATPLDDLRLKVGASIGVAEAVVNRKTIGEPLAMAASALQQARETGGNHIILYDASLEESRKKRLALQADIRRGIDNGEFDLEYQPIFDFNTEAMLGVEALLRWPRHPRGAMSPAQFIPAAESSGLIEELGLFALRRACEHLAPYGGLKLSVNVSTVQFRSPTLPNKIGAILAGTGFPASRLQLEITESFLLTQPERAMATIEELRGRGIAIALDDFGTGFSSVGYLRQFKFDRVKLDRSLVDEIDIDPVKLALVESTMIYAFAMGLAVTAEGVERREEAATLTRLGCREFQGYLFSRPLPLAALGRLVQRSTELKRAS